MEQQQRGYATNASSRRDSRDRQDDGISSRGNTTEDNERHHHDRNSSEYRKGRDEDDYYGGGNMNNHHNDWNNREDGGRSRSGSRSRSDSYYQDRGDEDYYRNSRDREWDRRGSNRWNPPPSSSQRGEREELDHDQYRHGGGEDFDGRRRRHSYQEEDDYDDAFYRRHNEEMDDLDRSKKPRRSYSHDYPPHHHPDSSDDHMSSNKQRRRKKIWPTPFESAKSTSSTPSTNIAAGNASYDFDARSGLFYEAMSDFFYDPKTKLYFGNEKKTYYKYCDREEEPEEDDNDAKKQDGSNGEGSGKKSKFAKKQSSKKRFYFKAVDQAQGSMLMGGMLGPAGVVSGIGGNGNSNSFENSNTGLGGDLVVQALQGGSATTGNTTGKKKIAICLKSKAPAKKGKLIQEASPVTEINPSISAQLQPTQSEKKRAADMEKWSQRVKDMENPPANSIAPNSNNVSLGGNKRINENFGGETTKSIQSKKVKRTIDGKPICTICKRKFADLEKLRKHEKLSTLHKENLEKMMKAKKAKKASSSEYRDRAKERRSMHGIENASSTGAAAADAHLQVVADIADMGPSLEKARTVLTTEMVAPEQTLDESNIGNKLLQKLGWKKGNSLGRSGKAPNENNSGEGNIGTAVDNLKQDWQRIESITNTNGNRNRGRKN